MKNKFFAFLLAATMVCTGFTTATPVFAASSTTVTVTKTTPAADTEAPTGSISIADDKWSQFLDTITFGKLFKEKKTVTIESQDNVAVASVKYYVSKEPLSLAEVQNLADADWMEYKDGFSLEPVNKYVVYALITDTSDNKTYLSSDGLVFINESAPSANVTDITQTSFKAEINIDENTLDAVKEAGVKYKKAGDTNWITVKVSDLQSENTVSVSDLQPGTDYEIISYINYKDGSSYESESSKVQTEEAQLPQGKVTVSVKNSSGETKTAYISIVSGNKEIAGIDVKDISDGTTADSAHFDNLPDGIYNIVMKTGKFTDTKMIEIRNGQADTVAFEIIKGEITNVVNVKDDTPPVAVDGISDVISSENNVVSDEDKGRIENGEISVQISFEVEAKTEKDAEGAGEIKKLAEEKGVQVTMFLDMSLFKVTTILSGDEKGLSQTANVGSINNQVLKIAVPYDTSTDGIRVIRYHGNTVQELDELDAMPDTLTDGQYFIGDGYIYIFASGFSTYAIGGKDSRTENTKVLPSGITATAPTGAGTADGKISGVDSSMEYSTDGGINWTAVTGNEITGLSAGNVMIRYAGTDTTKPGSAEEITVPEYIAPAPSGKKDGPEAPDASKLTVTAPTAKDKADGTITGVDETMEYSTDGGKTWKDVTGTEITGLAGGSNVIIRVKETDDTKAGAGLTVHVNEFTKEAAPQAPDASKLTVTAPASKDAADGTITGVDETMEYSIDGGKTWTAVTGNKITGLFSGKVLIRVAETDQAAAGEIVEITIPEYTAPAPSEKEDGPEAPDASKLTVTAPTAKDKADGTITGVDETMEYSIDGGKTWTAVTGNKITGLFAGKVLIRVAETDQAAAGEIVEITIPEYTAPAPSGKKDGPEAPDASKLTVTAPTAKDKADGTITGVDETMEYSIDGGKTWTAVTGNKITGLFSGKVLIRVAETDQAAAGEIVEITIPEYTAPSEDPKPGDGSDDKDEDPKPENPSTPSENPSSPSETPSTPSENPSSPSETPSTPSETPSAPSTRPETPAKKEGPKAPDASKVHAAAPTGKTASDGKITGVDSTMEYSTDHGNNWKDVTGTEITGLSAGEVWIRVKETKDTAAGEILKITIPAYSTALTATSAQTGDNNNFVVWFVVFAAAVICTGTCICRKKKLK